MPPKTKSKDVLTVDCAYCRREVNHKALGHDLRAEREKVGFSQKEVAGAMDISPKYLSDLENGKRPWRAALVVRFAAALKSLMKHPI